MATRNLFESATSRGRVLRQGDIVCLIVDGGGSMVMASDDFRQAQKWAQSKPASGNLLTDRGRFLEHVSALVSRRGSFVPTRGNQRQLEKLAKLMRQSGYDLDEWLLPRELTRPQAPEAPRPSPHDPGDDGEAQASGN